MPSSVTECDVSLVVTGTAERTEIFHIVRPTTGQRKYVMYLRRRCEPSGLKAVFAERMRPDVSFAYCSPCPVIPPDDLRITLIPVILPALGYPMFITVLPVCKVRAARIGAGVQWLSGHSVTSA